MAREVKLFIQDGRVVVKAPGNKEFLKEAKKLQGRYDKAKKVWVFARGKEPLVRKALLDIFGTTNIDNYHNCHLILRHFSGDYVGDVMKVFGKVIMYVNKGDGRLLLANGVHCYGGSCWYRNTRMGNVIMVRNAKFYIDTFPIPRTRLNDVQEAIRDGRCEVKYPQSLEKLYRKDDDGINN